MTSSKIFPKSLTEIDDLTRPDHHYLRPEDMCYFLGEYTARAGFSFSETNDTIQNFKKPMDRRGRSEWQYKYHALRKIASAFRVALNETWLRRATLIPIPPSKVKSDPLHDDRMLRMLRQINPSVPIDIREMIRQKSSTPPAHSSDERPKPWEIEANYYLDPTACDEPVEFIGLFDDVLTTGAHFVASCSILGKRFPGIKIVGFFVARRAPGTADFGDIVIDF